MSMHRFLIFSFVVLVSFISASSVAYATTIGDACGDTSPCSSGQTCSDSPVGVCVASPSQPVGTNPTGSSQPVGTNPSVTLINPLNSGNCAPNGDCLMNFLTKILEFVIRIGSVVVILMMVYVGYLFVTAQGEPGKITTARQALLWTLVGALILLGSQAIALAIKATVTAISTGG